MLNDEDKKRIEAEEAYRAQVRSDGRHASTVATGFKLEFGSVLFRLVGILVVLVVSLGACALLGR